MANDVYILEKEIQVIPIHFDVPGHQLLLSTFVETATQTEAIIRSFNRELFDEKLEYEIVVLPPEVGSFKSRLGIWAVAASIFAFVESDIGKAFIKGLTGNEPAYWAENAGVELSTYLRANEVGQSTSKGEVNSAKCRFETRIVVESVKSFLTKDITELASVGIRPDKFRDAFEARNNFYRACDADRQIRALGFEEEDTFPIHRSDFERLQVALPPKEDDDDEQWQTEIAILTVTSPNWDRNDKQRSWKGRDSLGKERYFKIEDEYFWSLVAAERLNLHPADTIKVQWAFRGVGDQRKDARVLRMLQYNDKILSEPLDGSALDAILERYTAVTEAQLTLDPRW